MIELGTCLGTTSLYLENAASDAELYTLEGCPETAKVAAEVFKKANIKGIKQVTGNFDDILPGVIDGLDQLDFVFELQAIISRLDKREIKNSAIPFDDLICPA